MVNPKEDSCPMCDTPLKDVSLEWASDFHGHAKSSCCGAHYQILSYYVDEEKGAEKVAHANSINPLENIELIGVSRKNEAMVEKYDRLTEFTP